MGTDEKCITSSLLFSIYTKKDVKTMAALKTFLENEISEWNMSNTCGIKPTWSNNSKISNLESIQVNRSVCVGGGSGEKYPVPIIGTIYNGKAYIIDFMIGEYTGAEKIEFDNLVSSFKFTTSEEQLTNDVVDQPAYLKSVYTKDGKNYITLDYIQMFKTSEERVKAMIEDGECLNTKDCYDFPNGYKRNINPLNRTFEVDPNVVINVYGEYNQDLNNGDLNSAKSLITFAQLKTFDNKSGEDYEQYVRIDVKNNKVTKIIEPYQE